MMANTDVKVLMYSNSAVVAGIYHAKGTNSGKAFDHFGRFTDTWVKLNGKWQCVASHTSNLKKTQQ
jgi:ketosteroid isomerase-like protein